MKIRHLLAAALLVVSAPSMAVPIQANFNLGSLGVPGVAAIGNAFTAPGEYQDNYSFSISESASASGLVLELDPWWNRLNLDVTAISLSGIGSFFGPAGLGVYNFGTLSAGTYTLSIFSNVTSTRGLFTDSVGYAGLLGLKDSATQVPEPATLALFGLGLLGVAFAARRRQSTN
ncbi:MAG: FxDxF family PEP-CTERM protein [Pseudomonadota bacterium]|nr:FxDxF family PEP-CTERM protein [Pseudomonadota bacterium]